MTASRFAAVLWDADGVLQTEQQHWRKAFIGVLGETLGGELYAELRAVIPRALAGGLDMADHLTAYLADHSAMDHREAVLAVFGVLDRQAEPRAVAAAVRAAGTPCYLATNQDTLRASYVRSRGGYDDLLDGAFYSCDLGLAKPDPAYFTAIATKLGLAPASLLFIDDRTGNVEGARSAGLSAERWHLDDGVDTLRGMLARHGVEVG